MATGSEILQLKTTKKKMCKQCSNDVTGCMHHNSINSHKEQEDIKYTKFSFMWDKAPIREVRQIGVNDTSNTGSVFSDSGRRLIGRDRPDIYSLCRGENSDVTDYLLTS